MFSFNFSFDFKHFVLLSYIAVLLLTLLFFVFVLSFALLFLNCIDSTFGKMVKTKKTSLVNKDAGKQYREKNNIGSEKGKQWHETASNFWNQRNTNAKKKQKETA